MSKQGKTKKLYIVKWPGVPYPYKRLGLGFCADRIDAHYYTTKRRASRVARYWRNRNGKPVRVFSVPAENTIAAMLRVRA